MGSFGGGVLSPGGIDHKAPGALGGGFGGVAKRMSRRNEDFGGGEFLACSLPEMLLPLADLNRIEVLSGNLEVRPKNPCR